MGAPAKAVVFIRQAFTTTTSVWRYLFGGNNNKWSFPVLLNCSSNKIPNTRWLNKNYLLVWCKGVSMRLHIILLSMFKISISIVLYNNKNVK